MDPLYAAVPSPNDPIPPPYEASEFDRKLSDAVQRSLHISNPTTSSSPVYQQWDEEQTRAAQAARIAARSSLPPPSPSSFADSHRPVSSASSHHRQNSISSDGTRSSASGTSRSSKERPSWYHEAGLGGSDTGAHSSRYLRAPSRGLPFASGSSSQSTSPTDDTPTRLPFSTRGAAFDDEAGIDNPPPPFAAATAAAAPANSLPPSVSQQAYRRPESRQSTSNAYLSPRSSAEFSAPPASHTRNAQNAARPTSSRRRSGSMSFGAGPAGVVTSAGDGLPHLAFDKNVAYGASGARPAVPDNSHHGLPPGAAKPINAAALYSSAVSAVLNSGASNSTSSTTTYLPQTQSHSHPHSSHQRQPTLPMAQSPLSGMSPASTDSGYFSMGHHARRPSSAQGYGQQQQAAQYPQQPWLVNGQQPPQPARTPSRQSTSTVTPSRPPSAPGHHPHHVPVPPPQQVPYPATSFTTATTSTSTAQSLYASAAKQSSSNSQAFYPGNVGAVTGNASQERWVPPGAAAPMNLYARRFV